MASPARAQGDAPDDQQIATAIARGVAFLKEMQSDEGYWIEGSQPEHRLGMTALAGLALMENGVAHNAPAISRARKVVVELAPARIKRMTWRWRSCSWRGASRGGVGKPMR